MNPEIEAQLEAIEKIIVTQKEACCKNLAETLKILKERYPEDYEEILEEVKKMLEKYNVNCILYLTELYQNQSQGM